MIRLVDATGDEEFERQVGMELLVETARLWRALGFHDAEGRFRIDGVTGPDEYTAMVDNNVYTNLMAQRNLQGAIDAVGRHPDRAAELGVDLRGGGGVAAGRGRTCTSRTTRSGGAPAVGRVHRPPGVGLRRAPRRTGTRCCCTTRTTTCTASRWSSRRTWSWPCTCVGTRSPRSRRRGTSRTTSR